MQLVQEVTNGHIDVNQHDQRPFLACTCTRSELQTPLLSLAMPPGRCHLHALSAYSLPRTSRYAGSGHLYNGTETPSPVLPCSAEAQRRACCHNSLLICAALLCRGTAQSMLPQPCSWWKLLPASRPPGTSSVRACAWLPMPAVPVAASPGPNGTLGRYLPVPFPSCLTCADQWAILQRADEVAYCASDSLLVSTQLQHRAHMQGVS